MKNIIKKLIMGIIFIIGISAAIESRASAANIIYTDKSVYRPGETITVTYILDKPGQLKRSPWIGIVPANIQHGSESVNDSYDVAYKFISAQSQVLTFTAPAAGSYDFRLNDDEYGGSEIATSPVFIVSNSGSIAVSSVFINKTNLSMKIGEKEKITAFVMPENATNKTLSWTSSDTSIVSVNSEGEVTAIKEGVADITCRSVYGGKTSICKVCVSSSGKIVDLENGNSFLNVGEDVEFAVSIQNIDSAKSEQFVIEYDESKLELLKVDKVNETRLLKVKSSLTNKVQIACSNKGIDSNEKNILLKLKFKALSKGVTSVNMESAYVSVSNSKNRVIELKENQLPNRVLFIN